jgi:phosphate:Na+ symporter
MVRTGIMRAYGGDLRRILGAGTRNRFAAFFSGLTVTALLQSSTATALLTTSFAGRELVAVAPALAIMLGADVGTTLVAQVFSLNIHWLSPLLVLVGVVSFMSGGPTRRRDLGRVAIGLGLMLVALQQIISASEPLRDAPAMQDVVAALAGEPLLAVLTAVLLTWLAHSSLAMVLLVVTFAVHGVIPLTLAFAMVLGANLGAAIPALVATLGQSAAARRVPLGNLMFRLIGVVAVLPFLKLIAPYVALLETAPARQVVNFHTGFNIVLAVVFIGLVTVAARLCRRLLPEAENGDSPDQPRYLDNGILDKPSLALAAASRETLRMGDVVETMLDRSLEVFRTDDRKLLAEIEEMDDVVDALHEAIKLYVTEISRATLSEDESRHCVEIITFTTNLEHIGDIIDKNLMELAGKKYRNKLQFSHQGLIELTEFHRRVADNLRMSLGVFMSGDVDMARNLLAEKITIRDMERKTAENHLERLREGLRESIESSALHLDVLRDLKRIHSHITSVAYPILDAAGELRPSRLKKRKKQKEDNQQEYHQPTMATHPTQPATKPT